MFYNWDMGYLLGTHYCFTKYTPVCKYWCDCTYLCIYLSFQNESLTRQLNLTTSELETLQSSQNQLLKSRQDAQDKALQLEEKIARIKERCEKAVLSDREKINKLTGANEQLLVCILFCSKRSW